MKRIVRICSVLAVLGGVATTLPAGAAVGTWTQITSPKGPGQSIYQYAHTLSSPTTTPTMDVSGVTSSDVANVNIYCFTADNSRAGSPLNAAPIPVSGGSFSAPGITAPSSSNALSPCVLRAVPDTFTEIDATTGTNTGFVGPFSGPTFYLGIRQLQQASGKTVGYVSITAQKRATVAVASADLAGLYLAQPVDSFSQFGNGRSTAAYGLASLMGANFVVSSGTPARSQIVVDGHNAYLPSTLAGFAAIGDVTSPTLSLRRLSNGNVAITESDPLRWCDGDAYPQSTGTCTTVRATGVILNRTVTSSSDGALVTLRDRFVSTNGHSHALKLEYGNTLYPYNTNGEVGVRLPGAPSFTVPTPNTTKTNLPVGAHTIYMTNDVHTPEGDSEKVDNGLTYSARPQSLFFPSKTSFALRYTRTLPATGSTRFGFALSGAFTMKALAPLAAAAQKAATAHLALSAPASSTSDHTPTIKGSVTNAVSGLPATVRLTIGSKSKTVSVNPTTGAFSTTWTALSAGKHTVAAVATDPSGFKLSATRTFKVT